MGPLTTESVQAFMQRVARSALPQMGDTGAKKNWSQWIDDGIDITPAAACVRPYHSTDFDACLRIFQSNVPTYFAESERAEFVSFLGSAEGEYLVVESGGAVVACGGSCVLNSVGRLCWGMVELSQHRASIGSALLARRLADLFSRAPQVDEVSIDTSQRSSAFFERFGFRTQQVTADGFGQGLDCVAMTLRREHWLQRQKK
jgi:hypothetical protein